MKPRFAVLFLTIALAAVAAMGQAPTLRIVQTDGPNLPADLFYGPTKVKPLRIRPGTNTVITIDDSDFFVSQHYVDFLSRFADPGGLDYWNGQISTCGTDAVCTTRQRVNVSAAFFIELEFQKTGSYVYRMYKGGLGRQPIYSEFGTDRRQVVDQGTPASIEAVQQAYALAFVQRADFQTKFPTSQTGSEFVNALIASIQANSPGASLQAQPILDRYNAGTNQTESRAFAVRRAVDDTSFVNVEYNPSFVLMQYFGYLRRDPDPGGYTFWLDVLNNRVPGNFRGMVCAFISSAEYQQRFSNTVTRTDSQCAGI